MEQLKDFLGEYNRTWSDLGLVPGCSIIRPESRIHFIRTSLISHGICLPPHRYMFRAKHVILPTSPSEHVWLPFSIAL